MEEGVETVRTMPDGFDGAIMAVESIEDAVAFLHGPGGCRVRLMVHSTAVFPRLTGEMDEDYCIPYFNGYPRVPATYLDEYDYINGAYYKVEEGLGVLDSKEPSLVVIINSPGAALIGDNHEMAIMEREMGDRAIFMDESLVSMPMAPCYGHTLAAIIEHLDPAREDVEEGGVILLGLTILDKDWMYARDELSGMIESMGLHVMCAPGAGASLEDLRRSVNAEYAVVVCPEACSGLSDYYESRGIRVISSPMGAPVGFDAIRCWVETIAEETGRDASVPLAEIERIESRIRDKLAGMKYNALRMKGMTFSVAGVASVVRPLTEWMYRYLAMAPVAVAVDPGADPEQTEALKAFLESVDYAGSFGREPLEGCGVVLCEGVTACTMEINGSCRIGIPIGHSSLGLDDIIPRPVYGLQGVMYIMDEMMHGVRGS